MAASTSVWHPILAGNTITTNSSTIKASVCLNLWDMLRSKAGEIIPITTKTDPTGLDPTFYAEVPVQTNFAIGIQCLDPEVDCKVTIKMQEQIWWEGIAKGTSFGYVYKHFSKEHTFQLADEKSDLAAHHGIIAGADNVGLLEIAISAHHREPTKHLFTAQNESSKSSQAWNSRGGCRSRSAFWSGEESGSESLGAECKLMKKSKTAAIVPGQHDSSIVPVYTGKLKEESVWRVTYFIRMTIPNNKGSTENSIVATRPPRVDEL